MRNRRPLRRISLRRLQETELYRYRCRRFLLEHPYCQVFLAENGIAEEAAVRDGGRISLGGSEVFVPLATQVHHRNKRRGLDLLVETEWLAVSARSHRRIEDDKAWARLRGYLRNF